MLIAQLVNTTQDIQQILSLQQENLFTNIDEAERRSQGFVTLHHDLATLEQMHRLAPSVIIKDDDKVVAYALTMLQECRYLIPGLEYMFAALNILNWKDRPLHSYRFYIMGQVCIAKAYRGQGLFEQLYQHHKKIYQQDFDVFITEIASRNHRSLRAHERAGFKIIHTYQHKGDEWKVVAWDWS